MPQTPLATGPVAQGQLLPIAREVSHRPFDPFAALIFVLIILLITVLIDVLIILLITVLIFALVNRP